MNNQNANSSSPPLSQSPTTSPYSWCTEPEIDPERQHFLMTCLATKPDVTRNIYPFKNVRLTRADIEWLLIMHENKQRPTEVLTLPIQIDQSEPLEPQITAVIDAVGLSSEEWQTRSLLINPPGYAPAACVLLAQLHGGIGHFPSLIRL